MLSIRRGESRLKAIPQLARRNKNCNLNFKTGIVQCYLSALRKWDVVLNPRYHCELRRGFGVTRWSFFRRQNISHARIALAFAMGLAGQTLRRRGGVDMFHQNRRSSSGPHHLNPCFRGPAQSALPSSIRLAGVLLNPSHQPPSSRPYLLLYTDAAVVYGFCPSVLD